MAASTPTATPRASITARSPETSSSLGGGILARNGTLTVNQSTISGNAAFNGGGIFASTLAVDHSTVSGNSATNLGGGIYAFGTVTVDHSTISDNMASSGGGIYAYYATAEIDHSTLDDPVGGGIVNDHSAIHVKQTKVDGVLYKDQNFP